MSITGAFLSSLTSLNSLQSQINTISNNVANANTAGYSSENLDPTTMIYGGQGQGVATGTVQRVTNSALSNAANQAASAQSYSATMETGLANYSAALTQTTTDSTTGTTTTTNTLTSAMDGFQSALTALSDTPGDSTTQADAVSAAQTVVSTLNSLDASVGTARETADSNINTEVNAVNKDLNALAANQIAMKKAASLGQSTAALQDQQDQLVSDISQYIPVKPLNNGNGGITLVTDGGTTLYDGQVHALSFTPTQQIPDTLGVTADASQGISAGLSRVTVNGSPIQMSNSGSIAANLQLRDVTLPQFASQLNELAGNVISAFQSADPSVSSGSTGLFTVSGAALTSSTTTAGLASTISLNAAVDPEQGGEAWRMQYGAQATSQGQSSDTSTVQDYLSAMNQSQAYTAATGISASSMLTASSSIVGMQQNTYANWSSVNSTRTSDLSSAQTAFSNSTGVNVDDEMQRLLLVQQTFAASSQIIQAASSMLQTINSVTQQSI